MISAILHISHSYDNDSEPWPVEIENHRTGELISVNLVPGQMLLYESAKCLHGRRSTFRGKYYGSLFLHYAPVNRKLWNFDSKYVEGYIPPHWHIGAIQEEVPYRGGSVRALF